MPDPTNRPGDRQRSCPGSLRSGAVFTGGITNSLTDIPTDVLTDTHKRFGRWDVHPHPDKRFVRATPHRLRRP